MQIIAELLSAIMLWLSAAVLSHFGVEVKLDTQRPAQVERVTERPAAGAARAVSEPCPEAAKMVRKQTRASI